MTTPPASLAENLPPEVLAALEYASKDDERGHDYQVFWKDNVQYLASKALSALQK